MTAQLFAVKSLDSFDAAVSEEANRERRDWAATVLGVPAEAEPAAARAEFARQLRQADFVPPDAWRAAYETLAHGPTAAGPALAPEAYLVDREPQLRGEVETLAREFFDLPVAERRARYGQLHCRLHDFPQLRARLESLEIGLDIERPDLQASRPALHDLVAGVCRLCVLRPLPRAIERQALVARFAADISKWELAARLLRQHHPQIAALAPELIDEVLDWRSRRARISKGRKKAAPKSVPIKTLKGNTGNGKSIIWIVAVVVISLLRLISTSDNSSRSTYRPTNLPSVPAIPELNQTPLTDEEFIKDILRRHEEAERKRNLPAQPTPPVKAPPPDLPAAESEDRAAPADPLRLPGDDASQQPSGKTRPPPSLPTADRDAFEKARRARQQKQDGDANAGQVGARVLSELILRRRKRQQGLDPGPVSPDLSPELQKIIRDSEKHAQETTAPANAPAEKEPASMP